MTHARALRTFRNEVHCDLCSERATHLVGAFPHFVCGGHTLTDEAILNATYQRKHLDPKRSL